MIYQQLGESDTKTYQQLDIKETKRFWTKIWQPKKQNENAEWINNITRELEGLEEGPKMEIHVDLFKTTLKRISKWKAPGHDGIHGFWFKKFTSIHSRLALEMNRCLQATQVPEWMTKGKTALIQKDPSKGTAPNNYRPITCLPMMWKILTVLYFDPSPRPKNAIPRWYTGRKWHIPTASNRKTSRGRIKAYDMGQGEGLIVPLQSCTGRQ